MPRTTSAAFKAAVFGQHSGEVFLALLSIAHADITTLRFVADSQDVTSNGHVYTAYPFDVRWPAELEDQPPRTKIAIDNVDRAIVDEIRSLTGAPDISLSIVLASDPDVIEYGPIEGKLRIVAWNFGMINGDIEVEDLLNEGYPGTAITPQTAPGLFI